MSQSQSTGTLRLLFVMMVAVVVEVVGAVVVRMGSVRLLTPGSDVCSPAILTDEELATVAPDTMPVQSALPSHEPAIEATPVHSAPLSHAPAAAIEVKQLPEPPNFNGNVTGEVVCRSCK